MKSKKVTIRQVAERAGVTIGTVSHVLNDTATISAETTARVKDAIRELNYVPNVTARSLRSKRNKMLGILVPNLNNNFYSRILSTFTDLAFAEGYVVQIFGYEYSVEKELQILHTLASASLDLVIIMNGCGDEEGINRLRAAGKQVILADRDSGTEGVCSVCFDNRQGVWKAIELFQRKGYQRVGYLSEPLDLSNVQERYQAYGEAMEKAYGGIREEDIFFCEDFRLDALNNGYRYMKQVLESREKEQLPDAFLATSDLLAIGAMRACRECGYEIPADFGFVSFDNLDICSFVSPAMTSIEQNQVAMGTALFELVKELHKDGGQSRSTQEQSTWEQSAMRRIVLPQKLIERESC